MISYLPAKVVPLVNSSVGLSSVFVRESEISPEDGNGVAHFLQNCESEVFSV
jgi:hypothetical protein